MTARLLRQKIPGLKKKDAIAIKEAILNEFPEGPTSYAYQDKVKQLVFNLAKHPNLLTKVPPATLVNMTDDELRAFGVATSLRVTSTTGHPTGPAQAPKSHREILKELLSVETLDEDNLAAHAPMVRCRKCGGTEVEFSGAQTRSADEGQTITYRCLNKLCRHKWSVS